MAFSYVASVAGQFRLATAIDEWGFQPHGSRFVCRLRSSVAEHQFCKLGVVGSNPIGGLNRVIDMPPIAAAILFVTSDDFPFVNELVLMTFIRN